MTDTKEFNKSLDRIAKALGGEEWSPEDKPEAIYKLLDKIADKLEEKSGENVNPLEITITNDLDEGRIYANKEYYDFFNEFNMAENVRVPCTITNHIIEDGEDVGETLHGYVVLSDTEDSNDGQALAIVMFYEYRFVYEDTNPIMGTINENVVQGYFMYAKQASTVIKKIAG